MSGRQDPLALVILSPVYEDWESAGVLLERIEQQLRAAGLRADVLFVDDGSRELPAPGSLALQARAIGRVVVLPLRRNLGHQRAIAIGLAHVERRMPCDAVVVMDSDGEDAPEDIPRLVEHLVARDRQVLVFAERKRRLENPTFQLLYRLYRLVHRALTGISVRVGNFSIVPASLLHRLVVVSELWNHYAAAVFASRIPHESIPTARAPRIAGRSQMNFTALVAHGLSAMSVHSEPMAVRVLAAITGAVLLAGGLAAVLALRLTADPVPPWVTSAVLILLALIAQLSILAIVFVFTILHRRSGAAFLPARDYHHYVDDAFELIPADVEERAAEPRAAR